MALETANSCQIFFPCSIPLIEDFEESSSIEDKILTYDTKSDKWSEIIGFEDIYSLFKANNLLYGMESVSSVTHPPEIMLIKYHTARKECETVICSRTYIQNIRQ